ncbi:JM55 [macacine gammaherpesvirus 11]|uniref:JM55 n=2 Tax=macacine gammaherpesvirus 11 TaxID=2560570 RepID=G9JM63_9GAMA|nr:JM55 [Macaca fuscata rhadinovirus]AAT00032.1 JM55 [Macaca fuscata rhadinovirus]AEW87580.1 JM55 [Macaca fuscata rhadinovirus]
MDAHGLNRRSVAGQCDGLFHVILPRGFILANNITCGGRQRFFAHTRFAASERTSKTLYVWGRVFQNTDPGSGDGPSGPWSGLAISLPLFTTNGKFHPFDVVILRAETPGSGSSWTVKFLYMSLIAAYRNAMRGLKDKVSQSTDAAVDGEVHPLTVLKEALVSPDTATRPVSACNPLQMLTGLLQSRVRDDYVTHHRALERPGNVRGQVSAPTRTEMPNGSPSRVRLGFRPPKQANYPKTWAQARHVFSSRTYYVCVYDNEELDTKWQRQDPRPLSLDWSDPVAYLLEGDLFLGAKQNAFVDSLEKTCRCQNYTIKQFFPVSINRDNDTVDLIKEHFIEACLVIRNQASERSAWVKAALFRNDSNTYWKDVLGLWEHGPHKLGTAIKRPTSEPCNADIDWSWLLCDADITRSINGQSTVCLVVSPALIAWLVLPGGFVIKGRYDLSSEDLMFVASRYGHPAA